ncbi:MAG: hypothetical protein V4754_02670 [Pseudomonadota bacterium]
MSSPALEAYLALLYTDDAARADFLADPAAAARRRGLTADEVAALTAIDRAGLRMAAASFGAKRAGHRPRPAKRTARQALAAWLRRQLRVQAPQLADPLVVVVSGLDGNRRRNFHDDFSDPAGVAGLGQRLAVEDLPSDQRHPRSEQ